MIAQLAESAHGALHPDRTLVFDCSYEVSRERLRAAGRAPDRFEAEGRAFFERVRSAYAKLAKDEPERVKLVDGAGSIEKIRKTLERQLEFATR